MSESAAARVQPWALEDVLGALDSRAISHRELVEAVADRLTNTETEVRAWVERDIEAALRDADELDDGNRASVGALSGIPIGVKDIIDVSGIPTRCGSRVRENVPAATSDAPSVASLRAAGALVMGKTVTQEFAAGIVSPPTRNPHDLSRIPGGSSGGSAAAVMAGSAILGLGTDTGGSLRIPAALTGAVTIKPTWGTVSTRGVAPLARSLDTVGAIAGTVFGALLSTFLLQGRHEDAARIRAARIVPTVASPRVGYLGGYFAERLAPDVAAGVARSRGVLPGTDLEWTDAASAAAASLAISRFEAAQEYCDLLDTDEQLLGDDLIWRLRAGRAAGADGYRGALEARSALRASLARVFDEAAVDALVVATTPIAATTPHDAHAVYADGTQESISTALARLTTPFNITGFPVCAVPVGVNSEGLPVGVSVIARPCQEVHAAQVAELIHVGAAA